MLSELLYADSLDLVSVTIERLGNKFKNALKPLRASFES